MTRATDARFVTFVACEFSTKFSRSRIRPVTRNSSRLALTRNNISRDGRRKPILSSIPVPQSRNFLPFVLPSAVVAFLRFAVNLNGRRPVGRRTAKLCKRNHAQSCSPSIRGFDKFICRPERSPFSRRRRRCWLEILWISHDFATLRKIETLPRRGFFTDTAIWLVGGSWRRVAFLNWSSHSPDGMIHTASRLIHGGRLP